MAVSSSSAAAAASISQETRGGGVIVFGGGVGVIVGGGREVTGRPKPLLPRVQRRAASRSRRSYADQEGDRPDREGSSAASDTVTFPNQTKTVMMDPISEYSVI